jgi:hypothetical protein
MQFRKIAALAGSALMTAMAGVAPALAISQVGEINQLAGVVDETAKFPLFVVGSGAAPADVAGAIGIAAELASKVYTVETVTITPAVPVGVETEDVPFNVNITATGWLKSRIRAYDVPGVLKDASVTFTSAVETKDYDFQEYIDITNSENQQVETSATKSKDFIDKPALFIQSGGLQYNWKFDTRFNTSQVSSTYPLDIEILGYQLKITDVGTNSITATIAEEYGFKQGDSVTVEGKTVTVDLIGQTSVRVLVDTESEIISSGTEETVGGLRIKVEDILYDANIVENRFASLLIGTAITKTYEDGDAFIGEPTVDYNWEWELSGITDSTTPAYHIIAVKYSKTLNDPDDNPPGPGEAIVFPNNYIQLSFDELTRHEMATYTIEFKDGVDLSNAGGPTSADTIKIHSPAGPDTLYAIAADEYTDTIYLFTNSTSTPDAVYVFYEDADNKIQFSEVTDASTDDNFADITFQDTIMDISWLNVTAVGDEDYELRINETQTNPAAGSYIIDVDFVSNDIDRLGDADATADGKEINIYGTDMGRRDESVLTHYGAVVKDPESNAEADKVVIDIPSSQVKATLTVGPVTDVVAAGETRDIKTPLPVTTDIAYLDTEITDTEKAAYDLILVGGPCVNTLVADLAAAAKFPYTCETWPAENFGVIQVIEDAFATGKVAVVIAGTRAEDTDLAARLVQTTQLADRTEAAVKVTGTVETPTITELTV